MQFSIIIIKDPPIVSFENFLNEIGFLGLTKKADKKYYKAIDPTFNEVSIGYYMNNLIICDLFIPYYFFCKPEITVGIEQIMLQVPNSEICSLIFDSDTMDWGFSIISNGKKVRVKRGDKTNGTHLDIGKPLPEEEALLSKSKINRKGERVYYLKNRFISYPENKVSLDIIFEVSKRYFKTRIDEDPNIEKLVLSSYHYTDQKEELRTGNNWDVEKEKASLTSFLDDYLKEYENKKK